MGAYMHPPRAAELRDGFRAAGKRLDMGKSCLRFKKVDDLPLDVIGKVIAASVSTCAGAPGRRSVMQRPQQPRSPFGEDTRMAENVYKVIELVGTSTESWEKAASAAVRRAAKSLRDLRVAEVKELDITMKDGKIEMYRAKVKVSFKYEGK